MKATVWGNIWTMSRLVSDVRRPLKRNRENA